MDNFAYDILLGKDDPSVPGGVVWVLASTGKPAGPNLPAILNQLGKLGWDIAALGDVGFGARVEIILKKRN